jgi:putative NIF3 family GTP cyclohydrolase 1 type 2
MNRELVCVCLISPHTNRDRHPPIEELALSEKLCPTTTNTARRARVYGVIETLTNVEPSNRITESLENPETIYLGTGFPKTRASQRSAQRG